MRSDKNEILDVTQFQGVRAVQNISYEILAGETLGIVGESGCGKSVTSFSLMGLIEQPGLVTSGHFYLNGKDIFNLPERDTENVRGGEMAMIFQEPMTALNPVMTIGHQIDEQILKHEKLSRSEARNRAIELLTLVGITSPAQRYENYPHQLSGGMRQRAMIAMALSCNPSFLIADEPTTALDVSVQAQILDLLLEMQEKFKMSMQFITHDLAVISEVADRVMVMYGGQICEIGSLKEIIESPRHPYTRALLKSVPRSKSRRLHTIEGSVPSLAQMPNGCPFANRCAFAQATCFTTKPVLKSESPISQSHQVACFAPQTGDLYE